MGARVLPGGRPRWSTGPRQHGHHNPPNCHHKSFKVTCAEFDALHDDAGSHCQLCGTFKTYLMLDHDHCLGQWAVRGLLCGVCNVGLGRMERGQREMTEAASRYLANAWHFAHRAAVAA